LLKLALFAPTLAICAKLVQLPPAQRSILNPVSLLELSVHARLIWLPEIAAAVNPLGAAGSKAVGVVVLATFEYPESPPEL
jgi:hypothetical protein